MQKIYVENIKEVLRNKNKLEKELEIKMKYKGKDVFVDGKAEKEFIAIEVLKAINLGFSVNSALMLKQENFILQTINIKDVTKRNDLKTIKSRIIGTHGKTLKTLKNLTDCNLSLQDNQIGIIGDIEEIADAIQAITSIIQGSKQSNVYGKLEKQRKRRRLENNSVSLNFSE